MIPLTKLHTVETTSTKKFIAKDKFKPPFTSYLGTSFQEHFLPKSGRSAPTGLTTVGSSGPIRLRTRAVGMPAARSFEEVRKLKDLAGILK